MLPGLTIDEARDLVLSIGTHFGKRRLSPIEVAKLFRKALDSGASTKMCAQAVGLTGPAMISRFTQLLKLSPKISYMVDWGQSSSMISFASAWRLAELSELEQELVAPQIIANQMNKEEVRQLIQLQKRSQKNINECVNDVLRMRPTITKRYVFLGAIMEASVRMRLGEMRQVERDEMFASVIDELWGKLPNTTIHLGAARFTVATDERGAERFKKDVRPGCSSEEAINQALISKVTKG